MTMQDTMIGAVGARPESAFFPIALSTLRIDELTDFDLYLSQGTKGPPVLYRRGNIPFDADNCERLRRNGITALLVPKDQRDSYLVYIDRHIARIVDDDAVPLEEKSSLIYDSAVNLVRGLMEEERVGAFIRRTENMSDNYVRLLEGSDRALPQLIKVMSFDYYTYTHSINVFTFSISLAMKAGHPREDVVRLGQGVLVHDIGKRLVGAEILNHRGKLSPEQWEIMRKHPAFGVDILTQEGVTDEVMIDVTRHHHEKLRGGGYPDNLSGEQVSVWARICTIADIFDALTTRRSYKTAISSFESLKLMQNEMSADLDPELFRVFIKMVGTV